MKFVCSKSVLNCRGKKSFYRFFLHLFTLFKRLFAPTSQSPMSKFFRFSESLGKGNEKKWSQIGKILLIKGVNLPRKKVSFSRNFAYLAGFFLVSVLLLASVDRCFVSRMQDFLLLHPIYKRHGITNI